MCGRIPQSCVWHDSSVTCRILMCDVSRSCVWRAAFIRVSCQNAAHHMHIYIYIHTHVCVYINILITHINAALHKYSMYMTCRHVTHRDISAPEASWRRVFDPCTPLWFDLYHYSKQNRYFGLVPEHAPGPSSLVLPGWRVWHPLGSEKGFVRICIYRRVSCG